MQFLRKLVLTKTLFGLKLIKLAFYATDSDLFHNI